MATESWSDFIQNAAQQVIDTRLQVYQAEKSLKAVTPSGAQYTEGRAGVAASVAGVSPAVLIAGGAAVLALVVFLLKD